MACLKRHRSQFSPCRWGTLLRSEMTYLEQFRGEVSRWQESITSRLQELTADLAEMEATRQKMEERLSAKLDTQDDTIHGFVRALEREMSELQGMMSSHATEHGDRMRTLRSTIEKEVSAQSTNLQDSAEKLLKNIKQHLERTVCGLFASEGMKLLTAFVPYCGVQFASFVSDVRERLAASSKSLSHETSQIADGMYHAPVRHVSTVLRFFSWGNVQRVNRPLSPLALAPSSSWLPASCGPAAPLALFVKAARCWPALRKRWRAPMPPSPSCTPPPARPWLLPCKTSPRALLLKWRAPRPPYRKVRLPWLAGLHSCMRDVVRWLD